MGTAQAVIAVGVSLVILVVMVTVMTRVNRNSRERIERQREAWQAAGNEGPYPGDDPGRGGYNIGPPNIYGP